MAHLDITEKRTPKTRTLTGLGATLICAGVLALSGCKTTQNNPTSANQVYGAQGPDASTGQTYNESDLTYAISNHLGATAESASG